MQRKKIDTEALEPEDGEVCLRYILKYSTRGGSNIFQLSDTKEKMDHFVANRRRWLERQGEKVDLQESWQTERHDIQVPRTNGKSPSVPQEDFENAAAAAKLVVIRRWVSVEDRRRRRVAFEETAKGMLRYLEDSEDLKVGATELQEQLGISEEAGLSIKQIAEQAIEIFNQGGMYCQFDQRNIEKISPESLTKMQDEQEVTSETSWNAKR